MLLSFVRMTFVFTIYIVEQSTTQTMIVISDIFPQSSTITKLLNITENYTAFSNTSFNHKLNLVITYNVNI